VAVYGAPRPDPEYLDGLLGRCEQLRDWARAHGFELDGVPDDLAVLDQALDQASGELGGPLRIAAAGNQAGLFLGTVIIATVPGTSWRLWPNGHPVVRLPSSRELDVVAMANDRVSKGAPLLADVYADAAAGPLG
jgi:hypothetical protein